MSATLRPLSEILSGVDSYDVDAALYLPAEGNWTLSTRGAVLDPDEAEDPEGEFYRFVEQENLQYALEVSVLLQVVENAREQIGDVDTDRFFEAFMYYFEHDAFKPW